MQLPKYVGRNLRGKSKEEKEEQADDTNNNITHVWDLACARSCSSIFYILAHKACHTMRGWILCIIPILRIRKMKNNDFVKVIHIVCNRLKCNHGSLTELCTPCDASLIDRVHG